MGFPTRHYADAWVEFSDTACMQTSFGDVWSAFTRNSYIARVTFEDGRIVCVAMPENARHGRDWMELARAAVDAAREMPGGGSVFL